MRFSYKKYGEKNEFTIIYSKCSYDKLDMLETVFL